MNDAQQTALILAALRLFQRAPKAAQIEVKDILTDGGVHPSPSHAQIDALCEAINMGGTRAPKVVIVVEGGLVQSVITDTRVNCALIDYDVQGAQSPNIVAVSQGNGKTAEAFCYQVNSEVTPGRAKELVDLARKTALQSQAVRGATPAP